MHAVRLATLVHLLHPCQIFNACRHVPVLQQKTGTCSAGAVECAVNLGRRCAGPWQK